MKAIVDKELGVIHWTSEEKDREGERYELSPEKLALAIRASDRAAEQARLERVGFVDFGYDKDELAKAKASRERVLVVYPDTRQETDESKLKGRELKRARKRGLRILHANKRKGGLKVAQPIVDTATGTVKFPKAEAKAVKVAKEQIYVYITRASAQKLATLAAKDGFKPDAETERGVANQTKKAISLYVQMVIDTLIQKRGA